jgi:hypothetical protein
MVVGSEDTLSWHKAGGMQSKLSVDHLNKNGYTTIVEACTQKLSVLREIKKHALRSCQF